MGGLPDGVHDLDDTLVVPTADPGALAARLLGAANGLVPSQEACRAHAERFAWDQVAQTHLDRYRQTADPTSTRMLRVVYVGHTAVLSGGELALARLLPALEDVEATVILAEDGPLAERLRRDGITVEVLAMDAQVRRLQRDQVGARASMLLAVAGTLRYAWRLRRRLHQLRPDLVHTNTLKAALYGGLAGRLAGVPVVWHVRDRITADYLATPALRLVRAAARLLPAAIIANSESTRATLGRVSRRNCVAVIPSPVGPMAARPSSARGTGLTVGMVGRLAPWKGQDMFLRAFAAAFATGHSRARIVGSAMFGEHDYAASLHDLADELGIVERVDFVGFVDDVACGVLPLRRGRPRVPTIPEPFGQVVVEAMAAGLPVVAPNAGGPAEVVTDGVDGLLYPMGDVDSLARHLRHLADDRGLRDRLGPAPGVAPAASSRASRRPGTGRLPGPSHFGVTEDEIGHVRGASGQRTSATRRTACVVGLRRSGNHAIIRWIIDRTPGVVVHLNDIDRGSTNPWLGWRSVQTKGVPYWSVKRSVPVGGAECRCARRGDEVHSAGPEVRRAPTPRLGRLRRVDRQLRGPNGRRGTPNFAALAEAKSQTAGMGDLDPVVVIRDPFNTSRVFCGPHA